MKNCLQRISCLAILLLILAPCNSAWSYIGSGYPHHYCFKVKRLWPVLVFVIPVTFGLFGSCVAAIRFKKNSRYQNIFAVVSIGTFVGAFLGGLLSILFLYTTPFYSWLPLKASLFLNFVQSVLNAMIQGLIITLILLVHDKEFLYIIPAVLFYLLPLCLILAFLGCVKIVMYWLFPLIYLSVVIWGLQSAYVIWRRGRPVQGL